MHFRILGPLLLFFITQLNAQSGYSKKQLLDLLNSGAADTTLINAYNELSWPIYSYNNFDSSIYFGNKAIALATQTQDIKRLSIAHRRIGITYLNKGDIKTSISHAEESYRLSEKINYKKGMQLALNNIGVAYLNSELFNKALGYFLKSLAIVEETKDYSSVTNLYTNCGLIYRSIGDNRKSKVYFLKAFHFANIKNDSNLLVIANCNLSTACRNLKQMDSARFYLNRAGRYLNALTPTATKFSYYLNEGLLDAFASQHQKALEAFLKCTPFITNITDQITLHINMGDEYKAMNKNGQAFGEYKLAFDLAMQNKTYSYLEYTSYMLAKIYRVGNDLKNYSDMMELHLNYKDSNNKINAVQQILRQQIEFDYERKQVADSIRFEQRDHLKNAELSVAAAELSRQKSVGLMLTIILITIILFSVFIFNRFVLIRRQKRIIELQKQMVDVKNQEILDSINYARRLQTAILPQISNIKQELDFDLLYLPKDIIGGDFYFFEKHNDHIFIAICDCTGHGIPGAIMSVVCYQALQKSIKEFNLLAPGDILTKTRQLIIESLNARQQNIKDGMDCSLLVIDRRSGQLSWAGANNPLWVIDAGKKITEIKADKQPVAFYENHSPFTTHELRPGKGSVLYLFTDGYADQFGGYNGKKYKNKALKDLLISVSGLPVQEQVEGIRINFSSWKQQLDQVDDVAVGIIKLD